MGNWNRVWLLFVVVAVGLILSWSQVAKKLALEADAPIDLVPDRPCEPWHSPCAAVHPRVAVVVGPAAQAFSRLMIKAVAIDDRPPTTLGLRFLPHGDGPPLGSYQAISGGTRDGQAEWQIEQPEGAAMLEIRFEHQARGYRATLPLLPAER